MLTASSSPTRATRSRAWVKSIRKRPTSPSDPDGTISATINNAAVKISPITIATFPNPQGLNSLGNNLYQETAASGNAIDGQTPGVNGIGTLAQGYIETSNVQVVEEMVQMIQAQRAYEINSKAIQTSDQMMQMANNLRQG